MVVKKQKIVIVDDNKSSLFVLQTISKMLCFDNTNVDVKSFKSFEEMVDFYEGKNLNDEIDVFVLDYELPDMNGMQFMKYYNKMHFQIPIIFVTGRAEDDLRQTLLDSNKNVHQVLFKPFNSEVYCKELNLALSKKIKK